MHTDTLTRTGADRLAADIQNYWHSRGYDQVRVSSYLIEGSENAWGTRSNLVAGMPPGVTARALVDRRNGGFAIDVELAPFKAVPFVADRLVFKDEVSE